MSLPTAKRVAIVGCGASGMSAAYALSKHPDRFAVTVFEKESVPGGMATSMNIDESKYGAPYINDGVQGCSPAFANTLRMFSELGFEPSEVGMQISFGKGPDFWSNVFPSPLTAHFSADIRKFGRALSTIKALEVPFALLPVHSMLSLFRFSKGFGEKMVYPLVALFFGTGNQTPYVSCAILERVFKDPSMRLFDYNDKSLLASIPKMYAFPKLRDVYTAWQHKTASTDGVTFKLGHEVTRILHRDAHGVVVEYRAPAAPGAEPANPGDSTNTLTEHFDELILAVDADTALKLLDGASKDVKAAGASFMERHVLGSVKYLWDVTVTHADFDYMRKYYETEFREDLAVDPAELEKGKGKGKGKEKQKPKDESQAENGNAGESAGGDGPDDPLAFARANFRPLYYTMQYPENRAKLEMSFDLTHYQPQFRGERAAGPAKEPDSLPLGTARGEGENAEAGTGAGAEDKVVREAQDPASGSAGEEARTGQDEHGKPEPPFEQHVFQTIFLDRDGSSELWTKGKIDNEKIIAERWWKQQSHRWQHYARCVPWMMFINGKKHTQFAGAWSVLNMHELAVTSGFAAAYRLGAEYPFKGDEECERLFRLYLALSHGTRMRKEDRKGVFA
ncbi:FAD/NAD(P)-binding domain-containing protein [Dentipellis sp. KUC8613]|nr:FAD/NAD(P)-binding domain-containing protein [Dentipellis sp. KUC8613]